MKRILYVLAGLALSFNALAQNTSVTTKSPQNHNMEGGEAFDDNSGFGIKGGVNFNTLRGGHEGKLGGLKNPTTWHVGFYGQFPLGGSSKFSLQIEALLNRRAFDSDSIEVKLDNIEVPLLYVFNIFDNVSLHIGPYAGVLVTAKENDKEVPERIKQIINTVNYGIAGGVEGHISFVRIGARYSMDLNEIYKEERMINNKAVQDIKNGKFQVYLGVGF